VARLVNGRGSWLGSGRLVCHCLLVVTDDGLVLVDTGLGTDDLEDPRRLPRTFRVLTRPAYDRAETAFEQVRALGYDPQDVRHIVVTHMDLDHAGGIGDFPWATVHLHDNERRAALARASLPEKDRYVLAQFDHHEDWQTYSESGEDWFGLKAVRPIAGSMDIALVPLFGHSRGHSGVAVNTDNGWLLHAGDAYYHHRELDIIAPHCPTGIGLFAKVTQFDAETRRGNVRRLAKLRQRHRGEVSVFCAHDPDEWTELVDRQRAAAS
jgi:glyoxylase-like metal-dependent hydrolase (beta-lactamase superfamily II)